MQTSNPIPTTVTPPPPLPPSGDEPKPNDNEFLKSIPVGWRFKPTSEEVILEYLTKKINNEMMLPPSLIHTVDFYASSPDDLSKKFRASGENEWFFFTRRKRKYKNGNRPCRAAGEVGELGYWKPNRKKDIMHNGDIDLIIGEDRNLTYFEGEAMKGVTTDWRMREFTVNSSSTTVNTEWLDDWVVCKLYKIQNLLPNGSIDDKNEKSTRKRSKKVKDGEANNNGKSTPPQSMESLSNDVASLPFPYNLSRLGLPFTQNRVGSLSSTIKYGEGTNMAAMQLNGASSYLIPTASFGVDKLSLPTHHHHQQQQVPSFIFESSNGVTTPSCHIQVAEKTRNLFDI